MSTNSKKYMLKPDVVFQPMDDEAIIVSLNSEEIFKLNKTGTQIVKQIEEKKTVAEIIENLTKSYDIDSSDLEIEVTHLLSELQKANLIEETKIKAE